MQPWNVSARKASLRQQNLTLRGREDVPDGLLFADDTVKDRANRLAEEWKRYELGLAVVESKRWLRPLDRRSGSRGEGIAPSTQMLRYLRRVDDLTSGHLRWGILTNGARWRLYWQGAWSVSEQFFEIDLAALLDLPGHNEGIFALTAPERRHGLKLFILFFRREAFLPGDTDSRTLHQRALEEGRFHQERVASNLSDLVFGRVFPDLARAIVGEAPDAPLGEVRDAALVVLYRLLFILYAEDRDLLPVRDERYDDYSLRDKVRGDVGRRKDRGDAFSETAARYWSAIDDLCRAVDAGDSSIGLPPYDGGLFDRESAPLLSRIRLGDRVMADVIMVLKRCVYGVDKNPMAVELAKVSLWLHTFTVGAPLGFLDHHLRCGDSLFGCWVRQGIDRAEESGRLFLQEPLNWAMQATRSMQVVEMLSDAEIDEAHQSAEVFAAARKQTAPLDAFLSLVHAFEWLNTMGEDDEAALQAYFTGAFGDPVDIAMGTAPAAGEAAGSERFAVLAERARALIARARVLAAEERFLNWQVAFPGVWSDWDATERHGGFDAVIGNPPWDRMKLQQVEWFATRRPEIARAQRAADRKRMIRELRERGEPLTADFERANERAESGLRVARTGGDYPWLSRGDVNLYSLFVERAMGLVGPTGVVGLLTPSGIASDKTAAPFFRSVATEGRLRALYDFENRKTFFPDVHASFKFCVLVASRETAPEPARCAFYLQDVSELADSDRRFPLTAEDFASVNPNTGTAPIFRTRRDAELTTAIYRRLPVLVERSTGKVVKTWPVKYVRMFDMTNDSHRFRTREELEEREGAWPIGGNLFENATGTWLPLYEGKMVQAFDHRAASIVVNPTNLHRPGHPRPATPEQRLDPEWVPAPQFWIEHTHVLRYCSPWSRHDGPAHRSSRERDAGEPENSSGGMHRDGTSAHVESEADSIDSIARGPSWWIGLKDVTAPTNVRSVIAAAIPSSGAGNTFPVLLPDANCDASAAHAPLILANLNSIPLDYVARRKIQGQHLNWYILEQLPVIPPEHYEHVHFGPKTAAEIVREAVLELTYTAHDMAAFARDLGYVDEAGVVKPPFRWDEERRLRLRAKLDAIFFYLYGVTDRDDIRYVYSTFPIVERQETNEHGRFRSRDLCLVYLNALSAGRPDAEPDL